MHYKYRDQGTCSIMKVAEALRVRSDLVSKISELRGIIKENAIVQEGDEPQENPVPKLKEIQQVSRELAKLITSINLINTTIRVEFPPPARPGETSMTMTEALAERDMAKRNIRTVRDAIDAATLGKRFKYSSLEIKSVSLLDLPPLRKKLEKMSVKLREIDIAIQEANWREEYVERV